MDAARRTDLFGIASMIAGGLLAILLVAASPQVRGAQLLVSQINPYPDYGVSMEEWALFTGNLFAAFGGAGNVTISTSSIDSLSGLDTYDALIVNARSRYETLNASEVAPLRAFIDSGKPVLLVGENANWTGWNQSILAVVGGSYAGGETGGVLTPVVTNPITTGVPILNSAMDGIAIGGTSLFDTNVVTLWGSGNVLSVLSLNMLGDRLENPVFAENVAQFLAFGGFVVPEPSSSALLWVAAFGFLIARRQVRARARSSRE